MLFSAPDNKGRVFNKLIRNQTNLQQRSAVQADSGAREEPTRFELRILACGTFDCILGCFHTGQLCEIYQVIWVIVNFGMVGLSVQGLRDK